MEWKKAFALFAGSFGFFLNFALYWLDAVIMIGNPYVEQVCPNLGQGSVDVDSWTRNSFSMLLCTYLDDFKSFGCDIFEAKAAACLIGLFYMILNILLCVGLITKKPEFIYGYQIGNVLSTIALIVTLVYVSYLIKLLITQFHL